MNNLQKKENHNSRIPKISINKNSLPDYQSKYSSKDLSQNLNLSSTATPHLKISIPSNPSGFSLPGTPRNAISKIPKTALQSVKSSLKKPEFSQTFIIAEKAQSSRVNCLKFPMLPGEAIKRFSACLQPWEQEEILNFSKVYYLGKGFKNKDPNYSDENGDYKILAKDQIGYRYEVISLIGRGTYGQVIEAYDHSSKKKVAIKIIKNNPKCSQQSKTEVSILKLIKESDSAKSSNIIEIKDSFTFRNHICIIFDLYSMNLYEFIKKNSFKGHSTSVIKRIACQLFNSLYCLKGFGVIHCDIKPENILIVSQVKASIKLIDLGSACFEDKNIYTYIQSRFYRAPEVILGSLYNASIDVWSLGCVLAELFLGIPLFPGEDENEQLLFIIEVLGLPPARLLENSRYREKFFDCNGNLKNLADKGGRTRKPASRNLRNILKGADLEFLSLIEQCIQWEPQKRIKPEKGINLDWLKAGLHKKNREKGEKRWGVSKEM